MRAHPADGSRSAPLPQDEHGELGQPVTGQDVDRSVFHHLARRGQAVTEESRAIGDPQRLAHRPSPPSPPPLVGVHDREDATRLDLVAFGHLDRHHRAGCCGVDGVLHLHRLEDDENLAGFDDVSRSDRHPHDTARHRGEGRTGGRLLGTGREPLVLDQGGTPVGSVDVGRRADPLDPIGAKDASLVGEVDCPGVDPRHRETTRLAVDTEDREPSTARVERVADRHGAASGLEGHLLHRGTVVAEAARHARLHSGVVPPLGLCGERRGDRVTGEGSIVGEGRGEPLEPVSLEEAGVRLAGHERGVTQGPDEQVAVGDHPVDAACGEGRRERRAGLDPARRMDDHLGEHRVVVGTHHAARPDPGVDTDGASPGDLEALQGAGGGQPLLRGVLRVEACLDRVPERPAFRGIVDLAGEGCTGGDQQLEPDQVEPGHRLGHRVFHLQAGVHLEEVGIGALAVARSDHELDRPRVHIPHGSGRGHRRLRQGRPELGRDGRCGGLLDDLLVTPLDAALAFEERDRLAEGVRDHLHLDVTWPLEVPLEEDRVVPERRGSLASCRREGIGELLGPGDDTHAAPATPGRGLDQQWPADRLQLGLFGQRVADGEGRQRRYPRFPHELLRADLRAHRLDRRGRWSDPRQPGRGHLFREGGRLRQEPVTGVDRSGPGAHRRLEQQIAAEVGFGGEDAR